MDHRRDLEATLANVLRFGVLLAASVVLTGGILYLLRHGGESPNYHTFRGEPAELRTIPGILENAMDIHGKGLIQLGLLLLIATPVTRVALAGLAFARSRDWLYALISLVVLSVLLFSLFQH